MEDSTTKEPTDLILEIQRELATILTSITLPKEAVDANLKREKEKEEKARLIAQVLELQNTLDDLSSRVDNVKEENVKLRSENQVLGQYRDLYIKSLEEMNVSGNFGTIEMQEEMLLASSKDTESDLLQRLDSMAKDNDDFVSKVSFWIFLPLLIETFSEVNTYNDNVPMLKIFSKLKSVQVIVRLHIFPIFSFLPEMKILEKYASGT